MTSMLEGAQELLTPALISRVGSQTGESEAAVTKGFGAVLPGLFAAVTNRSSDTGFMSQLTKLAANTAGDAESLTRAVPSVLSTGGGIDTSTATGGWLSSLLGSNLTGMTEGIARYAGLRGSSASSLLAMGAPLVLGYLGQLMRRCPVDSKGSFPEWPPKRRTSCARSTIPDAAWRRTCR